MRIGQMEPPCGGPAERQEYDDASPWWGEHASRYQWAAQYVPGKVVLDAACGSGFGSSILANAGAAAVAGVDLNSSTISNAGRIFTGRQVEYFVGDVTKLPFAAQTFDVVTSFETIEHIPDFMTILREFRRVLKEDGLLFCSTPNRTITSPDGVILNPYHFREFTGPEFGQVLSDVFSEVRLLGQRCRRDLEDAALSRLVWRGLTLRGIRKLPWRMREILSQILTYSPLFPAVEEFVFTPDPAKAPTLLGVCGNSKALAEWIEQESPGAEEL